MARTQGSAAERHGKLPKPSSRATTITNKAKGKTAKTKRNGNFPFLKLPGELRNRIYQYALIDPVNTVTITSSGTALRASRKMMTRRDFAHQQQLQVGSGLTSAEVDLLKNAKHVGQPWKWFLNGRLVPNLLQVCKQIHEEATPFLYVTLECRVPARGSEIPPRVYFARLCQQALFSSTPPFSRAFH
jgi:hypothetical protein